MHAEHGVTKMHEELEGAALAIYREAGADPWEPVSILALARALLGPENVWTGGTRELCALYDNLTGRLLVQRRGDVVLRAFRVAHELAEWWFARERFEAPDLEHWCNALAVRLLAPAPAFRVVASEYGCDLVLLATTFNISETMAALRIGEVMGRAVLVTLPGRHLGSGPEWQWPAEPPREVRRIKITDAPRRLALVADSLD